MKPAVLRAPLPHPSPEGNKLGCRQIASPGVLLPSWRHQLGESTYPGTSHVPGTVRPQAFSASRRFTPRQTLRPCFMPLPPKGFYPPGVFPDRAALYPHRKSCPPVVDSLGPSRSQQAGHELHQGRPPSGLCSARRSVFPAPLLHFAGTRSPHGLLRLFQVFTPPAAEPISQLLRSWPWPRGRLRRADPFG
jgi:hypothetical protein